MTSDAHLRRLYGMVAVLAAGPLVGFVAEILLLAGRLSILFAILAVLLAIAYGIGVLAVFSAALSARRGIPSDTELSVPLHRGEPLVPAFRAEPPRNVSPRAA